MRPLVKQVEHARTAGKRLLQRGAQVRHHNNWAERRHQCRHGNESLPRINHVRKAQTACKRHHGHVKRQHQAVGKRHRHCAAALQSPLHASERVHVLIKLGCALGSTSELQRLAQTAQAIKHKRVHGAKRIAQGTSVASGSPRGYPGRDNAYNQIGHKRRQTQLPGNRADKRNHHRAYRRGNKHRRKRVRIKHLKQLHVRGNQRHQIAFAAAFQLRRRQRAQLAKHAIAHQGQNLKRQVVVAHLLAVVQRPANQAAYRHQHNGRAHGKPVRKAGDARHGKRAHHRKEDCRQKPCNAQRNGSNHNRD